MNIDFKRRLLNHRLVTATTRIQRRWPRATLYPRNRYCLFFFGAYSIGFAQELRGSIPDPRNVEHKLCDIRASVDRTLACHDCNICLLPSQAVAIGLLIITITMARHTSNGC
ncbi:hypothetical protein HYQ44_018029 [Verticillium longisporum]|nr:hypothetical protein HYQ44_018029 [Verticillium longisporum]